MGMVTPEVCLDIVRNQFLHSPEAQEKTFLEKFNEKTIVSYT